MLMITSSGKNRETNCIHSRITKVFPWRERTAVKKKKEKYSKMFTTFVWGSGTRDNFFSATLWFLCYYLRKKKHFKICMCVLCRKTVFYKSPGSADCPNALLQMTTTWGATGSLLRPSFEGQGSLLL